MKDMPSEWGTTVGSEWVMEQVTKSKFIANCRMMNGHLLLLWLEAHCYYFGQQLIMLIFIILQLSHSADRCVVVLSGDEGSVRKRFSTYNITPRPSLHEYRRDNDNDRMYRLLLSFLHVSV